MSTVDVFRVNAPSVAWEEFEDETVIVNLESGQYFSTRDVGAEIWRRLAQGASLARVHERILALYEVDATIASACLSEFVAALQAHGLVVADETASVSVEPAEASGTTRRTFVAPVVDVYSDMQDLLLLDPIHEVDESGWPNAQ